MKLYFILIALTSCLLADLMVIPLMQLGSFNILALDVVFLVLAIVGVRAIPTVRRHIHIPGMWVYSVFIIILFLQILHGVPQFGGRALGEFRYHFPLLAGLVPFALVRPARYHEPAIVVSLFVKTIIVSGAASLALYIVEMIYGGRLFFSAVNAELILLEDFRGMRILGTDETFNLCACLILCSFAAESFRSRRLALSLLATILTLVIVSTRNRAAPIAIAAALIGYLIMRARWKLLLLALVTGFLLLGLVGFVMSSASIDVIGAFTSAFDIEADPTGSWRLNLQAALIVDALQHPVFGAGYGGYFTVFVPEFNEISEYPPHNAYIHLFAKTGILGLLLAIASLGRAAHLMWQTPQIGSSEPSIEVARKTLAVLLLAQFPYGLAYGFSFYSGLFIGYAILLNWSIRTMVRNRLNISVSAGS